MNSSSPRSKHSVVIRSRNGFETIDLALKVLQNQWKPILILFATSFVPFQVVNSFVCLSAFDGDLFAVANFWETVEANAWFLTLASLLVFFEIRLAGSLVVAYLGRWIFNPCSVRYRDVFDDWFRSIPQATFYLFLLFPLYYGRTYLVEIILLERTPFFSSRQGTRSTSERSRYFKRGLKGEMFEGSFFCFFLLLIWGYGLCLCYYLGSLVVLDLVCWRYAFYWGVYPLLLWSLGLFFVVFRFLGYINWRIVREGWDLDVLFNEECRRLDDRDAFGRVSIQSDDRSDATNALPDDAWFDDDFSPTSLVSTRRKTERDGSKDRFGTEQDGSKDRFGTERDGSKDRLGTEQDGSKDRLGTEQDGSSFEKPRDAINIEGKRR